ncbi:MAG: DUF3307 domain-containing protein [Paraclostridium sp.]
MNLNLIEIFSILLIHWFADFVLQTDKQAKGKSKNWGDLLAHTSTYTWCWVIIASLIQGFYNGEMFPRLGVPLFALITFICHTITDYFTSRLNSKLWSEGKVHLFFVSIGFGQILHYIQLFLTYWFLVK